MSKPLSSKSIGIRGLGVCVPDRVLTNKDLEAMVETSDEWITSRTGIKERRILSPGQMPSDIGKPAAAAAIKDAGLTPQDIQAVVCCTYTPDYSIPSTGCIIQGALGIPSCMAFDLNAACSGFVFGLQVANGLVATGVAKNVVVVAVDCVSRILDYTDRETCVLFGDGAGAVVVGEVPEGHGFLGHCAGADGASGHLIQQTVGAPGNPVTPENMNSRDRYVKMNGREVYKFAVRVVSEAMEKAMNDAGITVADIDLLVPHQANIRIIESAMTRFSIAPEKVITNMDVYGNTSAASIPLALDTARKAGKLHKGTTCAFVAFGAGLTYGATIVKW